MPFRQVVARAFMVSGLIAAGVIGGVIISGHLSAKQTALAPAMPTRGSEGTAPLSPMAALPDLSPVAERAIQASVNISSTQYVQTDNIFRMLGGEQVVAQTSLGSGVIVSPDGYVLTNAHVAQTANAEVQVTLPDNRTLAAKIVGIDEPSDLALLKVAATGLNPLPWGDSSKLRVAEWVLAVGNPFAFSQTVTLGIVSNVNRHDPQLAVYNDFIQTDAAINHGSSGGALVNARGELVGINTMIYSQSGGYEGIGFAIPANLAQQIKNELQTSGEIRRGSIGLLQGALVNVTPHLAQAYHLGSEHGVLVYNLQRNSPAAQAGLQPADIVIKFNDTPIEFADQLQRLIAAAAIGSTAKVEVVRGSSTMTVNIPVSRMTTAARGGGH